MKQLWGLLFDLDQTLVVTTAIAMLRDQGQWSKVLAQIHLTHLPTHTLAFLQRVRPHFQMGIVTSSPRHYAERLVAHHSLGLPVLAAYHDTPRKHKPDPEPLFYAARALNIPPSRCFHIGDHQKDILAAHRAGMVSIGLSWDGSLDSQALSAYPYTHCTCWQDVLTCLKNKRREN